MANNLAKTIFEQFLSIVERLSKKSCIHFNECDFEYRVRELVGHRLIDVLYVAKENCGRHRDVIATIDFTNICYEDLITCKWVDYLEKIARKFIDDICPKRIIIVKDDKKKCREEPPRWTPFPCRNITTVIHKRKPIIKKPECEVIIEHECECVPQCRREPCIPKEKIIIRFENEKHKCGDHENLVIEPEKKQHDWKITNGNVDYNNHEWKKCCGGHENHH